MVKFAAEIIRFVFVCLKLGVIHVAAGSGKRVREDRSGIRALYKKSEVERVKGIEPSHEAWKVSSGLKNLINKHLTVSNMSNLTSF